MSKLSKQLLSWLLLAAILCTLLPTAVFADDAAEELVVEPTADAVVLDDLEPQPLDADSEETVTEETVIEDQLPEDTEEPEPVSFEDELEAETVAASIIIGTRPKDGTTTGQPFAANTAGSQYFRIPAMVTLSDGTLVAAADARWNTTYDGGGLDTIVSRSTDGGETWSYTFANYLGDNGNLYNGSGSTAFIDPALVADENDTIYMLCDLYPYGVALNGSGNTAPAAGNGFNEAGNLKLSGDNHSSYNYYLKDGSIYNNNGTLVDGYTVDSYFNITNEDGTVSTNLFFSDSPYKVMRTGYLYLSKSTDKGATWSEPTLIDMKTSTEDFYGVGPGRGIVTSTGRIIFACYNRPKETMNLSTSVIYSDDGGETWTRGDDLNGFSEATMVTVDGVIYMFARGGSSYFYSLDNGKTWTKKTISGISYYTGCQLSAITYSKKIDGKNAIILSAPTNNRNQGKIFVGLVNDDQTINWKYTYQVNTGAYAYSCLTELLNGDIGLLYENRSGSILYTSNGISTVASGAEIGKDEGGTQIPPNLGGSAGGENGSNGGSNANGGNESTDGTVPESKTVDVVLYVGQEKNYTDETGNYESYTNNVQPDSAYASMVLKGTDAKENIEYTSTTVTINSLADNSKNQETYYETQYFYEKDGKYYPVYAMYSTSQSWFFTTTSTTIAYKNGDEYTVVDSDTSSSNKEVSLYTATTTTSSASTQITFRGVAAGTTTAVVGSTTYKITVKSKPDAVDIDTTPFISNTGDKNKGAKVSRLTISEGSSYSLTLADEYAGTNVSWSAADPTIATVENGTITGVAKGETTVSCQVDGVTYTIVVTVVEMMNPATESSEKTFDLYVSDIENTKVVYSLDASTDFVEVQEGEILYLQFSTSSCLNFFAVEDDGYALSYMGVTNSKGDYYAIYPVDDVTTLPAYSTANSALQNNIKYSDCTAEQIQTMLRTAVDEGYSGTTGFTLTAQSAGGKMTFASQKLPTIEKHVSKVNDKEYIDGMEVAIGDTITFEINVTRYATNATYGTIDYRNDSLTDRLTKNQGITYTSMGTSTTKDTVFTYTTSLTLTKDNFMDVIQNGKIVNTAELNYAYQAEYSSGTSKASADAVAEVSVKSDLNYVVDYGLDVEINPFEGKTGTFNIVDIQTDENAGYTVTKNTGDNQTFKFTMNQVLTDVATVQLTWANGSSNTVSGTFNIHIYPANNVLYEESFVTNASGWTRNGTPYASVQDTPANDDVYGWDVHYYDDAGHQNKFFSNDTYLHGTVSKDSEPEANFTFTGTGVELLSECGQNTGVLYVRVTDAVKTDSGVLKNKVFIVDTYFSGQFVNKNNNTVDVVMEYQVPVVQALNIPEGEHTVTVYGYYLENCGANLAKNSQVAVQVASAGATMSMGTDSGLNLDAILAEMGDEDAEVEYISMNEVLGGSDEGVAVYANQVYGDSGSTSGSVDVYIDGFRVYGPLGVGHNAYVENERSAHFESLYAYMKENGGTWNAGENSATGVVYVENIGTADTTFGGYQTNGPQNEIYLAAGSGIAFKVAGDVNVQVSAKAINGTPVLATASDTQGKTINTQTALYYVVAEAGTSDNDRIVFIYNKSNNPNSILSLTDVKLTTSDSGTNGLQLSAEPLTQDELKAMIEQIQNPQDPEEPSEPEEPSNPGDSDDDNDEEAWQNPFQDVIFGKFYYEAIRWLHSHGIIKGMTESEFGLKEPADRAMVVAMLYRLEGKPEVTGTSSFSDVRKGSYYEKAVIWAEQNYLVTGNPDGTFRPKQKISREELITILYRYNEFKGKDPAGSADLGKFSDNSEIHKYAKNAMRWAVDNGIVKGYNEYGQYLVKPRSETIRSEMATLLYRVYNLINGN